MKALISILLLVFAAKASASAETTTQIHKNHGSAIHQPNSRTIATYTIEQHEETLKEELEKQKKHLGMLHGAKENSPLKITQLTAIDIAEKERQLVNIKDSYQQRIATFENTIIELRRLKDDGISRAQIVDAEQALRQGNTEKIDSLYVRIETQQQAAIELAARAAFKRGEIAARKIDYTAAYALFQRAIALSPDNIEYVYTAATLALTLMQFDHAIKWYTHALDIAEAQQTENFAISAQLHNALGVAWQTKLDYNADISHSYNKADYDTAIDYYQRAIAAGIKTLGENHPEVAAYRNNLGSVLQATGHTDKAIDYYNLALSSDRKTFGEHHLKIAEDLSNLGSARQKLKQFDQSIDYYEQALTIFSDNLGMNHALTQTALKNLNTVKELKKHPPPEFYLSPHAM